MVDQLNCSKGVFISALSDRGIDTLHNSETSLGAFGRHLVGMRMKRGASMGICGGHEVVAANYCSLGG